MFWPMAQQYRHVVPLNKDQLPSNHNLFDLWARDESESRLLWAVLNSTMVALSKHQFGRAAGVEGNLKTEVVDVNMMLVPDIRRASPDAIARAVAACERMARRTAQRYLHEEFTLDDRRELDDATLEILGMDDAEERTALRREFTVMWPRCSRQSETGRSSRSGTDGAQPAGARPAHRTSPMKSGTSAIWTSSSSRRTSSCARTRARCSICRRRGRGR